MEKDKYSWSYGVFCGSGWDYDTAQEAFDAGNFWLHNYYPDNNSSVKVYHLLIEEVPPALDDDSLAVVDSVE